MTDFDATLRDMLAGRWVNPETGKAGPPLVFDDIRVMDTTDGAEAELIAPLDLGDDLIVVSDPRTREAMGARVARALSKIANVREVVMDPEVASVETVAEAGDLTRGADAVVIVGSGTLNDVVKHATFLDGRRFATFATAASVAGYTSSTASISKDGMKLSMKSHVPAGLFFDVGVCAAAPAYLSQAGLGDCLCRSNAQVDWRLSSALLGTPYLEVPFLMQAMLEEDLLAHAKGLATGDPEAVRLVCEMLIFVGLGSAYTGTSHHGSMSEHMVSHWIDMFAGDAHPGTRHGQQVGYASVSMLRLQHEILDADEPPVLAPITVDETDILRRYGPRFAPGIIAEMKAKAADTADLATINAKLADWDAFRAPLREVMLPVSVLTDALDACGGLRSAVASGLPAPVYRRALIEAREIRNRYSILDIAADSGRLETFAGEEAARR